MLVRARYGSQRFAFVRATDPHDPFYVLPLRDQHAARAFLSRILFDRSGLVAMRNSVIGIVTGVPASRLSDKALIDLLARAVADNRLLVIREELGEPGGGGEERETPPSDVGDQPTNPAQRATFSVRVVHDGTSQPIPGVRLEITLPNGRRGEHTTRADGWIRLEQIDRGACRVKGVFDAASDRIEGTVAFVAISPTAVEPAPANAQPPNLSGVAIAQIEKHKVATGETLDSLASSNGLTWQDLAHFNWGTRVPDEINVHLRDEVGCTHKTADGHNYMFNSSDSPGIVYIPRVWQSDGLATDVEHIVRVKAAAPLAAWIRLDVDPADVSHYLDVFTLRSTDGEYSCDKTVRDDHVPGDRYVDLRYFGLKETASYSLEVSAAGGAPEKLFENVPYARLAGLSPACGEASGAGGIECPAEDAPWPDSPEDEVQHASTDPGDGGEEQQSGGQSSGDSEYQQQSGSRQGGS